MTPNDPKGQMSERRFMIRYPSNSAAHVLRDNDKMRTGLDATLADISPTGLGIRTHVALEVGEQIKVRLLNEIQKFEKEVRGFVRHCTPLGEGMNHVGIELFNRLAPLEVSMLKMALIRQSDDAAPKWF